MTNNAFGYTFTMTARPGRGPQLRELLASVNDAATDVESWLIGTQNDNPDTVIGFEFFAAEILATRHDQKPDVVKIQGEVRELLAGPPSRTILRSITTNLAISRDR